MGKLTECQARFGSFEVRVTVDEDGTVVVPRHVSLKDGDYLLNEYREERFTRLFRVKHGAVASKAMTARELSELSLVAGVSS